MSVQFGKTTTIRRAAVHETGVSRHPLGVIEGFAETPLALNHYGIEVFKGGPQPHHAERFEPFG